MTLEEIQPTRAEFVAIVRDAARGTRLPPPVKRRLTLYAKHASTAVYGADFFAGGHCPLRAAGVTRNLHDAWNVDGARDFQQAYDKAMKRRVGLCGPCLIGIARDR